MFNNRFYSTEFKEDVLSYAKNHSVREACEQFGVTSEMVHSLMTNSREDRLLKRPMVKPTHKLKYKVRKRKMSTKEKKELLDKQLKKWVSQRINSGHHPSIREINMKASSLDTFIGSLEHIPNQLWAVQFLGRVRLRKMWESSKDKRVEKQTTIQKIFGKKKKLKCSNEGTIADVSIEAVKYAESHGNAAAAKEFDVSEELLCQWIVQNSEKPVQLGVDAMIDQLLENNPVKRSRNPKLEEIMRSWLAKEVHSNQIPVNRQIQRKALSVAKELGSVWFNASAGWLRRFKQRNGFLFEIDHSIVGYTAMPDMESPQKRTASPVDNMPNCYVNLSLTYSESECQRINDIDIKQEFSEDLESDEEVIVKRGFGSFHSSNIAEQITFSESASYIPPNLPFQPGVFDGERFVFGNEARRKHFFIEENCIFLNHGAFGATLKEGLEYYQTWQVHVESQPLRFFDRTLFPQVVYVQKKLADFVGCQTSDITFVSNVTTAINAVIQGLKLDGNSSIYYLNVTYGAVKKIIQHVCSVTGAKAIQIDIKFPISKIEDIISTVDETLEKGTSLAVFDHIPSNYAFIMPIKELVTICKQRNVPVLIDGAHGLGQLQLNLKDIDADYYAGNCHKWFCSPKGCAFLYVRKEIQKTTNGLIVSHGYNDGFHSQFLWTGVKDYCSYLSLHTLFNFWEALGPENVRLYCRILLRRAVEYFKSQWDAELLAPLESHCMMCCVSLPSVLFSGGSAVTYEHAETIQNRLYHDFNIEVPIKCIQEKLYVRISVHLYNEFSEYTRLSNALLQIAYGTYPSNDKKTGFL